MKYCKYCKHEIDQTRSTRYNVFCSSKCYFDHRIYNVALPKLINGSKTSRRGIYHVLTKYFGVVCYSCGIEDTYNNKPIRLEVDHINGDHTNDKPDNLRILCPNCHSQTHTYKNRNKGNGRKARLV